MAHADHRGMSWRRAAASGGLALAVCVVACDEPRVGPVPSADAARRAAAVGAPSRDRSSIARPRIVVLGDSLTAGLGLDPADAFPAVIERWLRERGYDFEVVNAGVSGDTTAGGVRRLDWVLDEHVRVLVVALGGNDGLRGLPVDQMRRNLETIIRQARRRGVVVVLAGMEAPPNLGEEYTREFRQVFRDLARTYRVAFVPFLLEGVAGDPALNQADGIHPNAAGARRVAENVWRVLEPLLRAIAASRATASGPQ